MAVVHLDASCQPEEEEATTTDSVRHFPLSAAFSLFFWLFRVSFQQKSGLSKALPEREAGARHSGCDGSRPARGQR